MEVSPSAYQKEWLLNIVTIRDNSVTSKKRYLKKKPQADPFDCNNSITKVYL